MMISNYKVDIMTIIILFFNANICHGNSDKIALSPLSSSIEHKELSLKESMAIADRQNLSVKKALVAIEQAEADYRSSYHLLFPTLNASFDVRVHSYSTNKDLGLNKIGMIVGVDANLPILDAPTWSGVRRAKLVREFYALEAKQIRQELLLNVVQTYLLCVANQTFVELYKDQIVFSKQHAETALAKQKAGIGSNLDVLLAQSEVKRAEQQLKSAMTEYEKNRWSLKRLMGVDYLPSPKKIANHLEVNQGATKDSKLSARAEIQMSLRAKQIAEVDLDKERYEFIPKLSFVGTGRYGLADTVVSPDLENFYWDLGLALYVPLYNYTMASSRDRQRASLALAEIAHEEAIENAKLELHLATLSFVNATSLVETAKDQAKLTAVALESAHKLYGIGKISSLEVIEAQKASEEARANLVRRLLDVQIAFAQKTRAAGKDIMEIVE